MDIAMPEIWKPLKVSAWYDVSDLGCVRSWRSRKRGQRRIVPTVMKQFEGPWGVFVTLRIVDGDRRTSGFAVAVLVAETFTGPRPPGFACRHLNDNRWDHRVSNLAWGTVADNSEDARRNGKVPLGVRHGCAKLSVVQVKRIRAITMRGEARSLAREFGVSEGLISMIRNGRIWKETGE